MTRPNFHYKFFGPDYILRFRFVLKTESRDKIEVIRAVIHNASRFVSGYFGYPEIEQGDRMVKWAGAWLNKSKPTRYGMPVVIANGIVCCIAFNAPGYTNLNFHKNTGCVFTFHLERFAAIQAYIDSGDIEISADDITLTAEPIPFSYGKSKTDVATVAGIGATIAAVAIGAWSCPQ